MGFRGSQVRILSSRLCGSTTYGVLRGAVCHLRYRRGGAGGYAHALKVARRQRGAWSTSQRSVRSSYTGSVSELRALLPVFKRWEFHLTPRPREQSAVNVRLDTIVRLPREADKSMVPVGVVSRNYVLTQHTAVLDVASQALIDSEINPSRV